MHIMYQVRQSTNSDKLFYCVQRTKQGWRKIAKTEGYATRHEANQCLIKLMRAKH